MWKVKLKNTRWILVKKSPDGNLYIEDIGRVLVKEWEMIINRSWVGFFFFKQEVFTPSSFQSQKLMKLKKFSIILVFYIVLYVTQ